MPNILVGSATTIFTPPATCISVITSGADPSLFSQSYSLFVGNFNGAYGGNNYIEAATSCYPSSTERINFWEQYYWSPAYCPSGHTPACSYTQGSFPPSITASMCCPSGFSCVDFWGHGCHKLTSGVVSNIFIAHDRTDSVPSTTDLIAVTLVQAQYIWGDGIPVAWQSTDTEILALISQSTGSSIGGGKTSPAGARSTTTVLGLTGLVPASSVVPSSKNSNSGSLSTGAQAGIGVGVGCAVLIAIGGLLFFLRSRRKPKPNPAAAYIASVPVAEVPGGSKLGPQGATPGVALPYIQYSPAELEGISRARAELPTSRD